MLRGPTMSEQLQGSIQVLVLYDVAEEIRLDELRRILRVQPPGREPAFKHTAPEYVRFERPPVVEQLGEIKLESGATSAARIKYFEYGVVSVEFRLSFQGDWNDLVNLACAHVASAEPGGHAQMLVRRQVERVKSALVKPYDTWLSEDYYIFHIVPSDSACTGPELLSARGDEIAEIVRGENVKLSDEERREVLSSTISYYPTDLAVVGWNAALVFDTAAGAVTTFELLEYANSQLLEFRHYDDVLTRQLESVYQVLEKGTGFLARWRLARASERLHAMLLEVTELTERTDNALKFLSDMFSARLYHLAANKVGVLDYKTLVNQKLETAEDLYSFMVEQFNQSRTFVLEVMVVIILIIELVMLFRGKS